MVGIQSVGGEGEVGNWDAEEVTTSATPNQVLTTTWGQTIRTTLLINDSDTEIEFGFGVTPATVAFKLKAGEIASVDIVHKVLHYRSTGASKVFRVTVVW